MGTYQQRRNSIKEQANVWGKSQWTPTHLQNLEEVIEDNPDLNLDKIQLVFWELGQGYWSASHFWEKLTSDLRYSLQVAGDKSYSVDIKE
mmetsp:Transcript_2350/g.2651  ORF Transcript_2350/g.2651 Transcript_2350/m.2651 type:complete len:90 (-) Transcript_2350:493-762(-)